MKIFFSFLKERLKTFFLILQFSLVIITANAQSVNWTFLKGYGDLPETATYGTQGTANANNTPGDRQNSVSWESGGKLYLFGGYGYAASGKGYLNDLWEYDIATSNWRWLEGSSSINQAGIYGTQGNADAANTPGARTNSVSWESGGKLYLFGGSGYAASGQGHLNDLWEYDTATSNWRWLEGSSSSFQVGIYGTQGTADVANTPGARTNSVSWESGGKLYLLGGDGYAASGQGYLNDLWEYDIATSNWRWLEGSSSINQAGIYGTQGTANAANTPGARYGSVSWESGGRLYLFGGFGYAASRGHLNDLWEYDTATGNWRWLEGSSSSFQVGIYGTQGTADVANTPGARQNSVSWESGGKLYLFGGHGYATTASQGFLNDLWEYDTATSNWRWLKGSNLVGQAGTYGTQGTADAANTPGARDSSVGWVIEGKIYLFGGSATASGQGYLKDQWEYDTATGNWRWLKGSSSVGIYGTQGTADAANKPGARSGSVSWESGGKLYLFGGSDFVGTTEGSRNDLWEYDTANGNWRWLKGSSSAGQPGTYGTQGTADVANTPRARFGSVSWESGGKLYLFGGQVSSYYAADRLNDLWEYNTTTGNWRWLKGSSSVNQAGIYGTWGTADAANKPGARSGSVSWESGGKLYLFGGDDWNDLWEYDTATENWRWLEGSSSAGQRGTYGTQGIANAANTPGARTRSVSWESGGKLFLFGGYGYAATIQGFLNDLWEYDTATGNWRWLKGSNLVGQAAGTYGTQGTADVANKPGARQNSVSWERGGKLYLFGGHGYATTASQGFLNDLWEYDTATSNWRWLKGSNLVGQAGTYGTQGTADVANTPGARQNPASWVSGDKLYLFGGYGSGGISTRGDLWTATFISINANLSSLTLSNGTLSQTFATETTSYTASVSNETTSITLTPTLSDATATLKVNGIAVTSGSASSAISLSVGSNTINILVTAQDGSTTKTYTLTVTRAASTNANLSALALSSGTLSPTFATGTTSYTASVSNETTSITLTPTLSDATATLKVNGTAVTSGSASSAISLSVGSNTINILVTAQDGSTTRTYTVTIIRDKLTQAISFNNIPAKNYGDAAFSLTATGGASGNTITYTSSNTAVATISGSIVTIVGAGSSKITASQAGNANYHAASDASQTLTVGKADLVVTAENKTKQQNTANPTLTATYSGFKNGDNSSVFSVPVTLSTTALVSSLPGNYPITVGGGATENYTLTYNSGTLTITPAYFLLPYNNFKVNIQGETCRTSDNGKISFSALQKYNYTATLSKTGQVIKTITFTENSELSEIAAGEYTLCFTVSGQVDFKQCFDIVITEPKDLSVYSQLNPSKNILKLALSGGSTYRISLNGETLSTSANFYDLKLKNGLNKINVVTDKECQGVYQEEIFVNEKVLVYPNPFKDILNLKINEAENSTILILIYDGAGYPVYRASHSVQNGLVSLDLSKLDNGYYTITIGKEVYKVLKK
jgi:N-acetylneuraminic acid mutarotase